MIDGRTMMYFKTETIRISMLTLLSFVIYYEFVFPCVFYRGHSFHGTTYSKMSPTLTPH